MEVVEFVERGGEWKFLDWREFGVVVGVRAQKSQSGLINCLNLRSRSVEVEVEKVEMGLSFKRFSVDRGQDWFGFEINSRLIQFGKFSRIKRRSGLTGRSGLSGVGVDNRLD